MSTPILGIDFGTTNTSGAYFDKDGKLRLVKVTEKSHVLPSVVWYHASDDALVGHGARAQIVDDPRHTVFEAKRFLGRRFQSEFVAKNRDRFAFDLVEGTDGYCAVRVHERVAPLLEVAARIVEHIATLAHRASGEEFADCVMTVPAHATFRQREAMRLAAEMAGLTVRAIVNEPTAAALYYANLRNPHQTVLIFDLGGGTFDATIMSVENRVVKVLATGGDGFLGGANFDAQIAEHFAAEFQERHGLDLRADRLVMQRLMFGAESAKIALSSQEERRVRIPCVTQRDGQFIDVDTTLTRQAMEEICFQLIERTASACDDVLERAGLKAEQIDELVFVGGQTRMPVIRKRFGHFKRFSSDKDVHPELGVAIGAAILGRNIARGVSGLADVVPMPISVMTPGGGAHEVIAANSPVPCKRSLVLEGLPPWQAPVPVVIFESLDATSIDREIFGMVQVGPEWRVSGAPSLQLELGQDFTLKARLTAPDGRSELMKIVEMGGAAR
jgi:molecular chaperone DnaK